MTALEIRMASAEFAGAAKQDRANSPVTVWRLQQLTEEAKVAALYETAAQLAELNTKLDRMWRSDVGPGISEALGGRRP